MPASRIKPLLVLKNFFVSFSRHEKASRKNTRRQDGVPFERAGRGLAVPDRLGTCVVNFSPRFFFCCFVCTGNVIYERRTFKRCILIRAAVRHFIKRPDNISPLSALVYAAVY